MVDGSVAAGGGGAEGSGEGTGAQRHQSAEGKRRERAVEYQEFLLLYLVVHCIGLAADSLIICVITDDRRWRKR